MRWIAILLPLFLVGQSSSSVVADESTEGSSGEPFVNSLGMKFVPLPGMNVMICCWETRVKDYAAFAASTPGLDEEWKAPDYLGNEPGPEHPVASVTWLEAQAFCAWLSEKEGKTYRLPSDYEWSVAVGIGHLEDPETDWRQRNLRVKNVYPWGSEWPPPENVGNLSGTESIGVGIVEGYSDAYVLSAPVGVFAANALGIYDLAGNVSEWCLDADQYHPNYRVIRGDSWDGDYYDADVALQSSNRSGAEKGKRFEGLGFRCVLELP